MPPSWSEHQRVSRHRQARAQMGGVSRSQRAATRATAQSAAPRGPERTKSAFDFVAWKGGVACSEAVQAMYGAKELQSSRKRIAQDGV